MPPLGNVLIRQVETETPPKPEDVDLNDDNQDDDDGADQNGDDQGRGGEPRGPRRRTRRPAATGATKGHKFSLPDSIFDRLQLTAIQRRKTVSAVVAEILDRNLPDLRIERGSR